MKYIPLAARICLCLIFINSGIGKIFGFSSTAEMMANQGLPIANILLIKRLLSSLNSLLLSQNNHLHKMLKGLQHQR